jgi:hypothetical protein
MKRTIVNCVLLLATTAATLFGCLWLQGEYGYRFFGLEMRPAFLLLWPGIMLARLGLLHTWVAPAIGIPVVCLCLGWLSRRRNWFVAITLGVVCAFVYCLAGVLAFVRLSVPMPSVTPYDNDATKRKEYIETYAEGYHYGISGSLRTYCFAPEHTTRGFYDGMFQGRIVLDRTLGRRDMDKREKRVLRAWAGTDGVALDMTRTNVEPSSAEVRPPDAGGQP